jgi:transcription elongation factor Elf1
MPLSALVNGEIVVSTFLDDEEWAKLKTAVASKAVSLIMPCCGSEGYLRTSQYGFQHFVHKAKQSCLSASETWEQLKVKSIIALACKAAGYTVQTEFNGGTWQADVYATKGEKIKVAFEVRSGIRPLDKAYQQQREYQKAGVRGCWFVQRMPTNYTTDRALPLFKVSINEAEVDVFSRADNPLFRIPLFDFVTDLMRGHYKFCHTVKALAQQTLNFYFVTHLCRHCGAKYELYFMDDLKTLCQRSIDAQVRHYDNLPPIYLAPELHQALQAYANSLPEALLDVAVIKPKYDKTTHTYSALFACPHCDAPFYRLLLSDIHQKVIEAHAQTPVALEVHLATPFTVPMAHWCYSDVRHFCCGEFSPLIL